MSTGTTGKKLRIEDLEYLVMEGGGARGAVYNGAIKALENLLSERSDAVTHSKLGGRTAALLDYCKKDVENELPIIQGIAGASAGAINTFVLALGLNNEEIDKVLEYEFDNFLKDIDVGRYRMINGKGELSIGEDKKNRNTNTKELSELEKFKFSFTNVATKIGDNPLKKTHIHPKVFKNLDNSFYILVKSSLYRVLLRK
ncbi:MAG: patatin-like phospholipase family protein [Brumimicrobium sp.]|nr:patatin-like phospholipase family protein [Brumimicrobium sp.]